MSNSAILMLRSEVDNTIHPCLLQDGPTGPELALTFLAPVQTGNCVQALTAVMSATIRAADQCHTFTLPMQIKYSQENVLYYQSTGIVNLECTERSKMEDPIKISI